MRKTLPFVLVLLALGCGEDEKTPIPGTVYTFNLTTAGLDDLKVGAYEGWLIYGQEKVSIGTYTTGPQATLTTMRDPSTADALVITVEPIPDPDPGPSGIVVLEGPMSAGATTVNLAFGADLSTASGGFILRTPTDDSTSPSNDEAGVWFLDPSSGMPVAGLNLPTLPAGWVWEGWAVHQGLPITTGRFTDVMAADDRALYSGLDGGPPFPGEDFVRDLPQGVNAPVNLADGNSMIVLTIEPDASGIDPTGDDPFGMKPLGLRVPMGLAPATFTALGPGPAPTIGGTATIVTTLPM